LVFCVSSIDDSYLAYFIFMISQYGCNIAGLAVMVGCIMAGIAGGLFLHPDFGVDHQNGTIRKAHKFYFVSISGWCP
jgi:hypothetical protein